MKKFKLDLTTIIALAAAVLGLITLFLMFAPSVAIKETSITYSGAQTMFGYSESMTDLLGVVHTQPVFAFSFMNFFTYLLLLVGIVFAVLSAFFNCKYIAPVAAVCFLLAGIFYFLAVPFCAPAVPEGTPAEYVNELKKSYTLGAGAIVSGVFSILSAIATGVVTFFAFTNKRSA